jgi:hypothetical protein
MKPYLDGVRGPRCIVCDLDFASHEWMPPAGWLAKGTKAVMGHDFTPLQGKPVRHPRFTVPLRPPNVHDR